MTGTFKWDLDSAVFRFENGNSVSWNGKTIVWEAWAKGGALLARNNQLPICLNVASAHTYFAPVEVEVEEELCVTCKILPKAQGSINCADCNKMGGRNADV